jgi:hypothetical protein
MEVKMDVANGFAWIKRPFLDWRMKEWKMGSAEKRTKTAQKLYTACLKESWRVYIFTMPPFAVNH